MTQETTMIDVNSNIEAETTQEADLDVSQDEVQAEGDAQAEYLYAGKYKTSEDLEKGYKELYSKFTEKRPPAPDEYKFDFSEHETLKSVEMNLDDDPTYQKMVPLFKELNLTQEQAQSLVTTYLESSYEGMPNLEAEREKLGSNADEVIARVNSFVAKNFTPEEQKYAESIGQTADGVKFLEKIAMMRGEKNIPTDAQAFAPRKSHEQLMLEATAMRKATPNFDIDKKAQARYEQMMDEAVKLQLGANT